MSWLERIAPWLLPRVTRVGTLHLSLPSGTAATIGAGAPEADLAIHDDAGLQAIARRGLLGFTDAYMDGHVSSTDLDRLLDWGLANHDSWQATTLARVASGVWSRLQRIRPERRHQRVRTMEHHYNLGNDFYRTWLDETMTYSSARFVDPDEDLATAQRRKYQSIAEFAGLGPGMRVLEIGCGWGGFAEHAASLGCTVHAITLSTEQARYAAERIERAGLGDRVQVDVMDFRDTEGTYDAVVSIEMIESIDEYQWPELFTTMGDRLAPGGRAVMQIIEIDDEAWETYRARADFIQQYIFPGGQLPAPKVVRRMATERSLTIEKVERFGLDYARTLDRWHQRFERAWPALAGENGFDQRFKRMWDLYLRLCATGFRSGRIGVGQWVFRSGH